MSTNLVVAQTAVAMTVGAYLAYTVATLMSGMRWCAQHTKPSGGDWMYRLLTTPTANVHVGGRSRRLSGKDSIPVARDSGETARSALIRVFISYSWDSEEHKSWVLRLANDLQAYGLEVMLDQWANGLGANLATFMVEGIATSDRVLLICTEAYVQRGSDGMGGVSYELALVSGELMEDVCTRKFIPVIRQRVKPYAVIPQMRGRVYIDLSEEDTYAERVRELAQEIRGNRFRSYVAGY